MHTEAPSKPPVDRPVEAQGKDLGFFGRYLTVWVALCIVAGVALGQLLPVVCGRTTGSCCSMCRSRGPTRCHARSLAPVA